MRLAALYIGAKTIYLSFVNCRKTINILGLAQLVERYLEAVGVGGPIPSAGIFRAL